MAIFERLKSYIAYFYIFTVMAGVSLAQSIPCTGGNETTTRGTNTCIQLFLDQTVSRSAINTNINVSSASPAILYNLIKDGMLYDFIFKFVMIFGVGYLISYNIFKR